MAMLKNARLMVILGGVLVLGIFTVVPALVADEPGPSHQDSEIAALRQAMADTTDPETLASLEEKLTITLQTRNDEVAAREAPVDPELLREKERDLDERIAAEEAKPKSHAPWLPAGDGYIVEGAAPPFPPRALRLMNDWFMEVEKDTILVAYAGASGMDQSQGMIIVYLEGPERFTFKGQFTTPGKTGALRVTGAEGMVIELAAEDGTTHHFDMATLTFV